MSSPQEREIYEKMAPQERVLHNLCKMANVRMVKARQLFFLLIHPDFIRREEVILSPRTWSLLEPYIETIKNSSLPNHWMEREGFIRRVHGHTYTIAPKLEKIRQHIWVDLDHFGEWDWTQPEWQEHWNEWLNHFDKLLSIFQAWCQHDHVHRRRGATTQFLIDLHNTPKEEIFGILNNEDMSSAPETPKWKSAKDVAFLVDEAKAAYLQHKMDGLHFGALMEDLAWRLVSAVKDTTKSSKPRNTCAKTLRLYTSYITNNPSDYQWIVSTKQSGHSTRSARRSVACCFVDSFNKLEKFILTPVGILKTEPKEASSWSEANGLPTMMRVLSQDLRSVQARKRAKQKAMKEAQAQEEKKMSTFHKNLQSYRKPKDKTPAVPANGSKQGDMNVLMAPQRGLDGRVSAVSPSSNTPLHPAAKTAFIRKIMAHLETLSFIRGSRPGSKAHFALIEALEKTRLGQLGLRDMTLSEQWMKSIGVAPRYVYREWTADEIMEVFSDINATLGAADTGWRLKKRKMAPADMIYCSRTRTSFFLSIYSSGPDMGDREAVKAIEKKLDADMKRGRKHLRNAFCSLTKTEWADVSQGDKDSLTTAAYQLGNWLNELFENNGNNLSTFLERYGECADFCKAFGEYALRSFRKAPFIPSAKLFLLGTQPWGRFLQEAALPLKSHEQKALIKQIDKYQGAR